MSKIGKRKLDMIEASYDFDDLKVPPSNHLETLKGNLYKVPVPPKPEPI